jgi:hypothetical protein
MTGSIDGLALRRRMGRDSWLVPLPFGPDGWKMVSRDLTSSIIVSCSDHDDDTEWIHASIARDHTPTYDDLVALHDAVWPRGGYAYQVFVPPEKHVNIHTHALHLWGRRDGANVLPDFGRFGTI